MELTIGLPTAFQIPFRTAFAAGMGYILGKIAGSSPRLWIMVSMITTVVDSIFFLMVSQGMRSKQKKIFTYACTSSIMCIIHIIALKQLNLIGLKGSLILTGLTVWSFIVLTTLAHSK